MTQKERKSQVKKWKNTIKWTALLKKFSSKAGDGGGSLESLNLERVGKKEDLELKVIVNLRTDRLGFMKL